LLMQGRILSISYRYTAVLIHSQVVFFRPDATQGLT
jgi:hypothetical protein